MNQNANESFSGARPAVITHSFSASPAALGSAQLISHGDPNHQRTLSLSEIHEELEQEQEAQVNRMMRMIRDQQHQFDQIRMQYESGSGQNLHSTSITAGPDDPHETEASHIRQSNVIKLESVSCLLTSPTRPSCSATASYPTSVIPTYGTCANNYPPPPLLSDRGSSHLPSARRGSRSMDEEIVYYEAEASWLARENQTLRMRVSKLEKQIADMELAVTGSGRRGLDAETLDMPSPLLDAMHTR